MHRRRVSEPKAMLGAYVGPGWLQLGHLGAMLASSWLQLGHLGALLVHLRVIWARPWLSLGLSEASFGLLKLAQPKEPICFSR